MSFVFGRETSGCHDGGVRPGMKDASHAGRTAVIEPVHAVTVFEAWRQIGFACRQAISSRGSRDGIVQVLVRPSSDHRARRRQRHDRHSTASFLLQPSTSRAV